MTIKSCGVALFLSLVCAVCYAQDGSFTENRSVGSFDRISSCCGVDVYISEGYSSTLTVETNFEEHLPDIKTEVKKGELKISFRTKSFFKRPNNLRVKVTLAAHNLTAINVSSGSEIFSTTPLTARDIRISANSGAEVKMELKANHIECSASSGSGIKLTGEASSAAVKASSGSGINMGGMIIKSVKASSSTGSDIVVNVTDEINAKASTGGNVKYKGNPSRVDKKKGTGGSVRQVD